MKNYASNNTLSTKTLLVMGFMTFSMFLGAGNIIFPVFYGFLAGANFWSAIAGFLISSVVLPLLGIVAMARAGGEFNNLTQALPKPLITLVGVIIYLLIGPLYAAPRTASVSYEIANTLFFPEKNGNSDMIQLLFALVFFVIAWWFSLYPGKLLETIGGIITPALIILLAALGIASLINPMTDIGPPTNTYVSTAFTQGFLDGYITMDALASLVFAIVIITNLRSHGINSRKALTRYCIASGIIAAIGLAVVYIALFHIGATSQIPSSDAITGRQILTTFVEFQFGQWGIFILAAIVIIACLTTAIGCITAVAEYFQLLCPNLSYFSLITGITFTCILMANVNLDHLIQFYAPILLAIYPVAMILTLLTLINDWLPAPKLSARVTLFVAALLGIADGINALPYKEAIEHYLSPLNLNLLPGFSLHISWLLPAILSLIITSVIGFSYSNKPSLTENDTNQ
ncbi:MAG: branched-chain amino acid transport system II carrier protein [Endozoicomonadaceae bacterium]|nr:branched-chain amino acid transport system II carrier protein [Endozoicomonadaceae bacterium]